MSTKTGILGSGFGLYGHMPTYLLNYSGVVLLPQRYKEKFSTRPELKRFEERIEWLVNEEELISDCDSLFIAQIPERQETLLESVIGRPNISFLLLEKPLAKTPERSAVLLNKLIDSGVKFRIMYSFLYTGWFQKLSAVLKEQKNCIVEVNWKFNAHHFVNDLPVWKKFHSQGGGVLRFYGIHVIAMAAALQFKTIRSSDIRSLAEDQAYAWEAVLENHSTSQLRLRIDSMTTEKQFSIRVTHGSNTLFEINQTDPFFEFSRKDDLDSRIDLNKAVLSSLFSEEKPYHDLYHAINTLWQETEKLSS